ncbi:helix-turn-helix domain-containing protein [Bacillota bacterium LX-D]|nr:helix-turn-helix domain-containing protein [Bacillota bacterium LX-D]
MNDDYVSRVPWSLEPSLKEKAHDAGIKFDNFIENLAKNRTDMEIAKELNVSEQTIANLREHFEKYGIHSIVGQD